MKVVNLKEEVCTHYCGRATSYNKFEYGIDLSCLGNPFTTKTGGKRSECIQRYSDYLWNKFYSSDGVLNDAFLELKNFEGEVKLGCFCKPKACHCDVIVEVFDSWLFNRILDGE